VSGSYFVPTARALSSDFRVFVPDLPGTGKSERPRRVLNVAELAEVLRAWLDAVGLARASFVGNSLGCQVLAELSLQAPERVDRMVFIGPTADPRWRSFSRQVPRWLLETTREPLPLLGIVIHDYAVYGPRRFLRTGRFALEDRLERKLPKITAPTLVVRGDRDAFVSAEWAEEVARLLPNGSLAILAGATHAAHYSKAGAVADLVRSFVERGPLSREDRSGRERAKEGSPTR
jgi:pimeloyl-ACP methyl ester carboxylesterase